VAIIAASVVLGARLMAAADDTVGVWSVSAEAPAGSEVAEVELEVQQVRFADTSALEGYYPADQPVPDDLQLTRTVGAGELLPRSATGPVEEAGTLEVAVAVEPDQVPATVGPGAVVSVYLISPDARRPGEPVLSSATVVDAPALSDSFATSGRRQLVLAVPEDQVATYFELIGGVQTPALGVAVE